jgi:hypothetical protein
MCATSVKSSSQLCPIIQPQNTDREHLKTNKNFKSIFHNTYTVHVQYIPALSKIDNTINNENVFIEEFGIFSSSVPPPPPRANERKF